jgi:sugar O-acyltransferase (sialic acid O-acetyltransferase NeuD family)
MIIAGAGGHAKEILGVFAEQSITGNIFLFDDIGPVGNEKLFNQFRIIASVNEAKEILAKDPSFVLGVGNPAARKSLVAKLTALGGKVQSVISPFAKIGSYDVQLGKGLNIMTGAVITQNVNIGDYSLIHVNATVHHDCTIGEFCEISPGSHILGKVSIGNYVSIGAGAVILPGKKIGDNVVIGAGAVVTKDVIKGSKVIGVPAKLMME